MYKMIQRHTIKDCWSQEPGKLSKGREEISPLFYKWKYGKPEL